jgi:hypothetical protein
MSAFDFTHSSFLLPHSSQAIRNLLHAVHQRFMRKNLLSPIGFEDFVIGLFDGEFCPV